MVKFHVSPDGVARRCNAGKGENARGCKYGYSDEEHYTTKEGATKNAEQKLNEKYDGSFNKNNKNNYKNSIISLINPENMDDTEKIIEIGSIFNKELEKRLGFDINNDFLTDEQYMIIAEENRRLFNEITENKEQIKNETYGVKNSLFKKTVQIIPDSVKNKLSKEKIYIKSVNKQAKYDGMFRYEKFKVVEENSEKVFFDKGSFYDTETLLLQTDEIFLNNVFLKEDLLIDGGGSRALVKNDDGSFSNVWVGAKTKNCGKQIKNNFVGKIPGNNKESFDLPVYQIKDTGFYQGAVIKVKSGMNQTKTESVILHEYTHLVQSNDQSAHEHNIFMKLAGEKYFDKDYETFIHKGFPDTYMGLSEGKEVLTRATEGFFYPQQNNFLYGSKSGENAETIRNWVAGYWLNQ